MNLGAVNVDNTTTVARRRRRRLEDHAVACLFAPAALVHRVPPDDVDAGAMPRALSCAAPRCLAVGDSHGHVALRNVDAADADVRLLAVARAAHRAPINALDAAALHALASAADESRLRFWHIARGELVAEHRPRAVLLAGHGDMALGIGLAAVKAELPLLRMLWGGKAETPQELDNDRLLAQRVEAVEEFVTADAIAAIAKVAEDSGFAAVHVTDAAPAPGVDTPEDLERVRLLYRSPA